MISNNRDINSAPFPILLGSLKTDERIENVEFKSKWTQRFPRVQAPEKGNLWLVFQWDEASFRTLKRFPPLPQVVEGMDYFRKSERDKKRWRFIRKILKKSLDAVDFIHRQGYCHNCLSAEALWMTTTNQQEIDSLSIKVTEFGIAQKLSDLGPVVSKQGVFEDFYQLGLVFLELIMASFCDDNLGAQRVREILSK